MQRRHFLATPPALAAALAAAPLVGQAAPAILTSESKLLTQNGKGPRIVR